ncbi:MAG: GGDEF domain-containing protein [Clostridia bacterium]|nr:GGDEF domain-containing protein [Clostridia bacterium]
MESMERALLYAMTNFSGIIIIIIMLYSRRNTSLKTSEKVYFNNTLITIGVLLFISSMLWFCECSAELDIINNLMAVCYSATLPLIGMFYVFYCECRMSDEREVPRTKKTIFLLPVIFNAFVSLISIFNGIYFDIVDSKYVRGPLYSIPFVVMFAYLIYASVTTYLTAKKQVNLTKKPEFLFLASFSILPVISGVIQMIFYGAEFMAISMVISILIVYNEIQNRLISIDPLTITNNKWQLNRYLERVGKSLSPQMMLFVMFIDIDNYKSILRTYGREGGNEAIVEAATRLKKICSGTHDFLCRIGTDRFVIVAQRPSEPDADNTRTEISRKFEELGKQDFKAYEITVSIGLAGAEAIESMDDVDALIAEAEKDMRKIRSVAKRFADRFGN